MPLSYRRVSRRLAATLLLWTAIAHAQTTFQFDIPAQPLAEALRSVGRITHLNVLFDAPTVDGLRAPALKGNLTPDQAFARLLIGTALKQRFLDDSTVTIGRAPAAAAAPDPLISDSTNSQRDPTTTKDGKASSGVFHMAQAGQGSNPDSPPVNQSQNTMTEKAVQLEEVVVTGTRLPANESVHVQTYDSTAIAESGKTSVTDFLNTLPEVSVDSTTDRINSTGGQTTVRLRGFPSGTTLVLLNGRRVPISGDTNNTFDLSALPIAMIERIDILPSGSSAIYGSDAIAGVVNFITKKHFDGLQATASQGFANDYKGENYSVALGKSSQRGSVSVVGSFDTNDHLLGTDRAITATGNFSQYSAKGGIDTRLPFCNPGTVSSLTGANLPGLNSPLAGIPKGLTGRPTISDFSATQGTPNLCGFDSGNAFVPSTRRGSVLAEASFEFSSAVEGFAELLFSHTRNNSSAPGAAGCCVLAGANPYNPFGQDVLVEFMAPVEEGPIATRDYVRPTIGLRGRISNSWAWEVGLWRSQDRNRTDELGSLDFAALTTALASASAATAFNPFTQGQQASPAVLSAAYPTDTSYYRTSENTIDGFARGDLFKLPSGAVSVVVGGEVHHDQISSNTTISGVSSSSNAGRTVQSVYSELRAPILDRKDGGKLLEVSAAVRHDHYSDFGSKATPQFGIELRPVSSLAIRGSYSQAFKAPSESQLNLGAVTFSTQVIDSQKPGNPLVVVPVTSGGNSGLGPETGKSKSVGATWSPDAARGLLASVDFWHMTEDDRIVAPRPQTLINFPTVFPGRVVRDPTTGDILSVDARFVNFGTLNAEGFDLGARYQIESHVGTVTPSVDWTIVTKFDASLRPGAPIADRLSQGTPDDAWAVRNKGTVALTWKYGEFGARLAGRFIGSYKDYQDVPNSNRLGAFWLLDLNATVDLATLAGIKTPKGALLRVTVSNLLNRSVDYSNYNFGNVGYDPAQYDLLGRLIRVGIALDL